MSLPAKALESWPAERFFDVRWAATVVEQAMRQLREECEQRGRRRVFDNISPFLAAERSEVSYSDLSGKLNFAASDEEPGASDATTLPRALRAAVAETVESPNEIDDEIRYPCSMLIFSET